jgi:hypothetical protein
MGIGQIKSNGAGSFTGIETVSDDGVIFDGTGKLSGVETRSVDGTIISAAPINGTYSVASTCRGTISYKLNGAAVKLNIVMVSGGKSFFTIETDSNTVSTSVAQQ